MKSKLAAWIVGIIVLALLTCASWRSGQAWAAQRHYDLPSELSLTLSNSDRIIAQLRHALKNRSWRVTLTFPTEREVDDMPALVAALMDCAVAETDDPCEGDYLLYQYGGYELRYSRTDGVYTVSILPDYYTTAEEEAAVTEALAALPPLYPPDADEAARVRAVCTFICETADFDAVHRDHPNWHIKSTAYGALIRRSAACQGYAVLAYRMLREAGIGARVITGTAYNETTGAEERHAWDLVQIGGYWYHLDLTWMDQQETEDWYLKTDADFPYHRRDPQFADEAFYAAYPMADDPISP